MSNDNEHKMEDRELTGKLFLEKEMELRRAKSYLLECEDRLRETEIELSETKRKLELAIESRSDKK